MMQEIDFVVTWVDGGDPAWRREKGKYTPGTSDDGREERYRDFGLFRYWFRGVERFAPWVRKVHLVTWGHVPEWLNTDCPKLNVVRHDDFIPKEFLPTFNSNVIEIYMHRIEGLAEQFVYFNDDIYLTRPIKPEFFFREDLPCDMLALQPVVANRDNPVMSHLFLNNALVLSKYFDKRENVRSQPGNYFHIGYPPLYFFYNLLELSFPRFTGFYTVHGPMPFLKSTFSELWEKEEEALRNMSHNRFRSRDDLTPYLFREYQKLSGRFRAKNIQKDFKIFPVFGRTDKLLHAIRKQKKKIICINDISIPEDRADEAGKAICEAFRQILPSPSGFEKDEAAAGCRMRGQGGREKQN